MQYRTDQKSGNKLSVLGLGCMRFPRKLGVIDAQETERIVMGAVERGVNYFDTAYIYPGSEEALGTILAKHGVREKVYVASKLPLVLCKNGGDFDRFFGKELERLKTGYIDYYLLHMLTDRASWERLCGWGIREWLAEQKAGGRIRHIGFSFHGIRDEFLALLDVYDWELCQIQYNYSDENYQAGVAGLKKAHEKGLPVVIMEPLLGGKLAGSLPEAASEAFRRVDPAQSNAAWALRWLWEQAEVTLVLSGMSEFRQLAENAALADSAAAGMLSDAERDAYRLVVAEFNKSYKIRCTGCNYCMPCPRGVNIPSCFAAYNTSFSLGFSAGMQQYTTSTGATSIKPSGAGLCVQCGKCETHCPQRLPIRESLKAVRNRMEPWWYRAGVGIFRRVTGR